MRHRPHRRRHEHARWWPHEPPPWARGPHDVPPVDPRLHAFAVWAQQAHWHHAHWHAHRHRRRGRGLRSRIFRAFGLAIFVTLLLSAALFHAFSGAPQRGGVQGERARMDRFMGDTFAPVWADPVARHRMLVSIDRDLQLPARLRDGSGRVVDAMDWPSSCKTVESALVRDDQGRTQGHVEACVDTLVQWRRPWQLPVIIVFLGMTLWALAGAVARRLTRPLAELTHVARRLGDGDLSARVNLCDFRAEGEVGALGLAVNEMAERIERQLRDQRQLLGAVSHELRTPLTRIRLLLELARDGLRSSDRDPLDEIDREVVDIDALVADLLASSRVDFAAISPRELDAQEIAQRALQRAALADARYESAGGAGHVVGDATLLARALGNLLENARKYGGPKVVLRVRDLDDGVAFEVDDDGRGFADGDEAKVFEPFYRGTDRAHEDGAARDGAGVGLGLALVKRIAEAHGGRVWARNLPGGGARVALELPRVPPSRVGEAEARD